uniref:Uncharacterized protein n=1 Tax=Oryza punctata TaxID=4537 RepID=A0A0E0LW67_ORYPU
MQGEPESMSNDREVVRRGSKQPAGFCVEPSARTGYSLAHLSIAGPHMARRRGRWCGGGCDGGGGGEVAERRGAEEE